MDAERGDLWVKRQVSRINGEVVEAPLKTKNAYRTLPLAEDTVSVLKEQKKKAGSSPWVFPSPSGGRHRRLRECREEDKTKCGPSAAGRIWKGGAAERARLAGDGEESDPQLVPTWVKSFIFLSKALKTSVNILGQRDHPDQFVSV